MNKFENHPDNGIFFPFFLNAIRDFKTVLFQFSPVVRLLSLSKRTDAQRCKKAPLCLLQPASPTPTISPTKWSLNPYK